MLDFAIGRNMQQTDVGLPDLSGMNGIMEAQGTEVQIHNVLKMINTGMYIHIDRMVWKELPLVEEERGFHVR